MAQYTNRLISGVYTGGATYGGVLSKIVTPVISGYSLRSLSAAFTASGATPAGALQMQVSNLPNPALDGYGGVIPEANWMNMPDYGSGNKAVLTIVAGAAASLIAPYSLLAWRWYRLTWADSGLTAASSTYTPPTSATDNIQINGVPFLVTFNTTATQTVTDLKALIAASTDSRLLAFVYTGTTTLVATAAAGGAMGNGLETFSTGANGASWNHNPSSGGLPTAGDTQASVVLTPATSGNGTVTIAGITLAANFSSSATVTVAAIVALIQANATLNALVFAGAPGATLTLYARARGAGGNGIPVSATGTGASWAYAATQAGVTGVSNLVTVDVAGLSTM